jgi:hypothetical protein
MDKYKRVEKEKKDEDATPAETNEVRITQQGAVRSYVTYAHGLMQVRSSSRRSPAAT